MTDLNHRHLWSEERRRQWHEIPESWTSSSSGASQKMDSFAPVTQAKERGRKWNVTATVAFERARSQDPNISAWNLCGTCCKPEHNHHHGCCEGSIGCQS